MKLLSGLVVILLSFVTGSQAQPSAWPERPIKFIVSSPAGSAPDIVGRLMADRLTAMWGRQIIVDNRGGATGLVGASAVAHAEPDGYTLGIMQTAAVALAPAMYKNPQFNALTDFKPLAMIGMAPLIVVVNPSVPATTLRELIDHAKSRPVPLNFALSLPNSVPHLVGEQLAEQAGFKLNNVPYNGAANATLSTMSGDTQLTINSFGPIIPHVVAGKLKAIAVTSATRLDNYPDIPAASETVPGFAASGWFAVFGQAKMSDALADRINVDINKLMAMPDMVAKLAEQGIYPDYLSRPKLDDFVRGEQRRWATQVQKMGIVPQ